MKRYNVEAGPYASNEPVEKESPTGEWVKYSDIAELEKAAKRYECVRKLNAQQFADVFKLALLSDVPFDRYIDGLIDGTIILNQGVR